MRKLNLLIAAGLVASASVQAQTIVAELGFEQGDATGKSSKYSLSPGLSLFGDWVNVKDGDVWAENFADDKVSGEYAFKAVNAEPAANSWDRGFKIANVPVKDNTPYRVSFWVKGPSDGRLSSWLSKGIENFDKSICSPSGANFGVDGGFTNGEWQHFSFVSYYGGAEVLDNVIADQSWVGNAVYPEDFGGDGTKTYAEFFDHKLPEEFFFIVNMYSPGEYLLDDIKIEEGVTFNQATFATDVIKLDFGYPTNIAALANANGGTYSLDPSTVTVTANGEKVAVEYVEGKADGFIYIFFDESVILGEEDDVKVSFTPAADSPIIYTTDRRPSSDTESELKVAGFTDEKAYLDASIDALPSAWSSAKFVSSVPENESFEIVSADFKNIAVTFDKELDLSYASATLTKNGVGTSLTDNMTLSEDQKTINIAVSNLADGEYTLILAGITNSFGMETEEVRLVFAVGPDNDTSVSKSVYSTNQTFSETANGTFPVGWVTDDNGTIHQYGVTETGDVWNYNWGGNIGGGGTRAMTGYTGDLNGAAIYWRCMNGANSLGTLTFGEQVKDYTLADGSIDPEMPEGVALYLDASKYQITIRMCAWKNLNGNTDEVNEDNAPKYNFTLEDLAGNVYARFDNVPAMPNVNGAQDRAVNNVTRSQTDFTVEKAGYYMLKFTTTQPNGEYLLGGVDLITMPSKAAFWKQQLAEAITAAEAVLETATEDIYDGDTKTAFVAAIENGKNGHFTSPSEVNAVINELQTLGSKLSARVKNLDDFDKAVLDAVVAYETLEGKYVNADIAVEAKGIIDQYQNVNASTLSDDELAEVAPKLVSAAEQMANVKDVVDVLTWRAYKAAQTAATLGVAETETAAAYNLVNDDDDVVNELNLASKLALYDILAKSNGVIADSLKTTVNYESQKIVEDGVYVDKTEEDVATSGIDFTALIKNPHLYTYATDFGASLKNNTVVGWDVEQFEGGSAHLSGDAATSAKPVVNSTINAYGGGAEYKFFQVIENLPVGVYDVFLRSRTALKNQADESGIVGVFNALNDTTGLWDKYIFAQVDDEEPIRIPFSAGSSWSGHPSIIPNVAVKEGQKLTIGVVEHYTSGKASGHDYAATDAWDTNTFAGDPRLYFVAPLEGFDYAKAYETISTGVESVDVVAPAKNDVIYNLAGQRVDGSFKGIVIKNGKKILVK